MEQITLLDAGPLMAVFEPSDRYHDPSKALLGKLPAKSVVTTSPVLTEVFHLLPAGTDKIRALRAFVRKGGVSLFSLKQTELGRALQLMGKYEDRPMDFADASLVVAAESLETRRILTVDRTDFLTYKISKGYQTVDFNIIGPERPDT